MPRRIVKTARDIDKLSKLIGRKPAQFREAFDHLKNASLKIFIGEFLLRNPDFLQDCKRFHEDMPPRSNTKAYELFVAGILAQKYGALVPNWRQVAAQKEFKLDVRLLPSVRGFKVIDTARADEMHGLIAEKQLHFSKGDSETAAYYSIRNTLLEFPGSDVSATVSDKLSAIDYLMGGNVPKDGRYPFDNYLLLSVDLNRPRHEVNDSIKRYLDIHLPAPDSRKRTKLWIRYLMVFDLKAIWGMNWEEIETYLAEAFPELKRRKKRSSTVRKGRGRPKSLESTPHETDENLFGEERNLLNYFDEGKKLILGNYRDYIRFSQTK